MIGEWHEKTPSGESRYIHVSALPDYAERRRAAALERPANEHSSAQSVNAPPQGPIDKMPAKSEGTGSE
jgi:hypothetical protein